MPPPMLRPATADDLPLLQEIRREAFAPVFASFRDLLGDELYEIVQARDDAAQPDLLDAMFAPDSPWAVHVAETEGEIVGFVSHRVNRETEVGEIGLNAVRPGRDGQGVGTAMYEFALARMKEAGMKAATVGTGGDPSHAPARRAYEKAGFDARLPTVWMSRRL